MLFNKVALIGIGLIGGSFAIGAKKRGLVQEIIGYDRNSKYCEIAKVLDVVDDASPEFDERLSDVDLVVLATPVGAFARVLEQIRPYLSQKTLITDVGSVKTPIVEFMAQPEYEHLAFVAGHPIAGGEKFGPASATPALFQGKKFIITPSQNSNASHLQKIRSLWEGLGAAVYEMDCQKHDHIFADVSHLPHLLAYACMESYSLSQNSHHLAFSGAGLKDFSRIAASSPEMWADIFLGNQEHLLPMLHTFQKTLQSLESAISSNKRDELIAHFEEAKKLRDQWMD